MLSQSPSQIYKSSFRGHEEDETYRCLLTFNFGNYFEATRVPFGTLETLNDETLGTRQSKVFTVAENTALVLIPLVGTLHYKDDLGAIIDLHPEEIQCTLVPKSMAFCLENSYETELINYLQIRLKCNVNAYSQHNKAIDFTVKNILIPILRESSFRLSIGIFSLRSEGVYIPESAKRGVFAFVVAGAFEFQNRLLESRDGLSLWNVDEIEFEALSESAILLVIETNLQD